MKDDDQDDAARAFLDLKAEVKVIRRAVEAMAAKEPIDYSPTLGQMTKRLEDLTAGIIGMSKRPAVALTPDAYAAQLRRATEDAARPVSSELQRAQTLTGQMERALGGIKTLRKQRAMVLKAGAGGLAVGVVVWTLLLPSIVQAFPASWRISERAAVYVLGEDRWTGQVDKN